MSGTAVRLHTYWRSSAAYRVRIALAFKGLEYEPAFRHLVRGEQRADDYLGVNPQGLVPALEHGGAVLSQSLAIIEYLEESYPEPPLLPVRALDRAKVRALALHVACDIHPLNNLRVLKYLRDPLGASEEAVRRWYAHWIAEGFRALEAEARALGSDGRHLFGGRVTLADVCLVPQLYNARRFGCDLAPYPTLVSIAEHLERLPAFAAARPEAQPDAE